VTDTILEGDALEVLRGLPEGIANTCVTSPPYWGLRDYGTATWEGGSEECDHLEVGGTTRGGPRSTITGVQDISPHSAQYRRACAKCGAKRIDSQLGLEPTPEEYITRMVEIFAEVKRVLRDDGTAWVNMGDCYNNFRVSTNGQTVHGGEQRGKPEGRRKVSHELKEKDLVGMPWRLAFALQADGWYLRSDIIWSKPNPMPESVTDRPTKAHEYIFLLSKRPKYQYDADAIREGVSGGANPQRRLRFMVRLREYRTRANPQGTGYGQKVAEAGSGIRNNHSFSAAVHNSTRADMPTSRNKRTVWHVSTAPFPGAHFATFPPDLIEPCVLAGCPRDGLVLDPFMGAGTTAIVALKNARHYLGIELNPEYAQMARDRIEYGTVDEAEIASERKQGSLFK